MTMDAQKQRLDEARAGRADWTKGGPCPSQHRNRVLRPGGRTRSKA